MMTRRPLFVLSLVVASLSSFVPVAHAGHPTRYIDDSCTPPGSGLFYADGPAQFWHTTFHNPSPGSCYMWTNTVNAGPINTAAWYLPVAGPNNGLYAIVARIPCAATATAAKYWRYKFGTAGGVTSTHILNQDPNCDVNPAVHPTALWYNASDGGYIKMVDQSTAAGQILVADQLGYIARH
jgi:hypothetical protein